MHLNLFGTILNLICKPVFISKGSNITICYIDVENFKTSVKNYGENPPFDYAIIDNFFKPEVADQLAAEFPDFDSDKWHDYNNAIEVKKTCNNWNVFPPLTYKF